jgi:hypothetical protein
VETECIVDRFFKLHRHGLTWSRKTKAKIPQKGSWYYTVTASLRVAEIICEEKDEPVHKYLQVLRTRGVAAKIISIQQNR